MSRPRKYADYAEAYLAHYAQTLARKARLRAAGCCPVCGQPVTRFVYCLACRQVRREAVRRWDRQHPDVVRARLADWKRRQQERTAA